MSYLFAGLGSKEQATASKDAQAVARAALPTVPPTDRKTVDSGVSTPVIVGGAGLVATIGWFLFGRKKKR